MEETISKVVKGQFFTKEKLWLKPQVKTFIENSECNIAYDPFAGAGDLIRCSKSYGINTTVGLDIDKKLGWQENDSLKKIPSLSNAIIITNPPYLSNYSASRKGVMEHVKQYFSACSYNDLYLLALDKMLEAQKYVVAIVPETFINSTYKNKNLLSSITILEENPFKDTDNPVCVVCFDGVIKDYNKISVYKNDKYVNNLYAIDQLRIKPSNNIKIKFNDCKGWLGIRAVDSTDPKNKLKFDYKENFDYDWENGIKVSSRLFSLVNIDVSKKQREKYIEECNKILSELRQNTADIILSPFKGNMKNGERRRRLDFYTARAIMEQAYIKVFGGETSEQLRLF